MVLQDIPAASALYPAVRAVLCRGLLTGYADGTFRPDQGATRGQVVKVLVAAFPLPASQKPAGQVAFADVPPTHPFFAPITAAAAAGLVAGYPCGGPGEPCDAQARPYFRPDALVTRSQVLTLLGRALGWDPQAPVRAAFADVPPTAPYRAYLGVAVDRALVAGYPCGGPAEPCDAWAQPYFRPTRPVTRGQLAQILFRTGTLGADTPTGASP